MQKTESIEKLCQRLTASLAEGTFVRLVLSAPTSKEAGLQKVLGRAVSIRGDLQLSLTLRYATRDVTKNISPRESGAWLASQLEINFRSALLGTTLRDWQFISDESGAARLIDHKPTTKTAPTREHDRKPAGILDASARDWLQGLGVLDRDGKLRTSMSAKHRQINHYLEILSHLAVDCGWISAAGASEQKNPEAQTSSPLTLADMACGKGYLTFGAWHLFHRVWKKPVRVVGVESRTDLVATTKKLARQIQADGLDFVRGEIASAKLPPADALIALHACDTATDDAIRRGIASNAKLIIVAPCCHKQLRPQLGSPEPLAAILTHGLMQERMAEWVSDGLRALVLNWAGYRTKILEFVASEHTPKNLMLAAIREHKPFVDESIRHEILEVKKFFGVQQHALDSLLQTSSENDAALPAQS